MRFTQLSVFKSLISLTLCSLLILSSNLLSSESEESEDPSLKSSETEREFEPQAAESDDPDARSDWFTFQRTYPAGSIPADARRKALAAVSKIKLESN